MATSNEEKFLKYNGVKTMIKYICDNFARLSHTHTKKDITDFPTSMPASDVYAWAKASTKPTYSKAEVGLGNVENKSSATIRGEITKSNVTSALGYTPYTQAEVDNKFSALETNIDWKESVATYDDIAKTYPNPEDGWTVNVKDTDYTYRYSGTSWVAISANAIPKATDSVDGLLAKEDHANFSDANSKKHTHSNKSVLDGITSALITAWNAAKTHADSAHARTDATKTEASTINGNVKINGNETTVYSHPGSGTNPHGTTKSDLGLGNVGNFKAVSTVASQGLTDTEKTNARTNIGAQVAGNYASSSQGSKADTAVQSVKIGTTEYKNGTSVTLPAYPTTLPASDVPSWAKATTKPAYTKSEVGLGNVDNTADANKSVKYATSAGSADSATSASKATSVVDYGNSDNAIQIGFSGEGATISNLAYIAGYLTGGKQIKDVSKDVLKAWLGLGSLAYSSATIPTIPSSLPANGGNAATVNGHTVNSDVPEDAKFTDTNTWRPVVDNLTSTSTDSSLSANQGKVLKDLVDTKQPAGSYAAANHTHSQYLTSHQDISGKQDKSTAVTHTKNTAVGNSIQPVYVRSDGVAVVIPYTIEKSVPKNAVFTDTTYSDATTSTHGLMSTTDKTNHDAMYTALSDEITQLMVNSLF